MKRLLAVGAVVVALAWRCCPGGAQEVLHRGLGMAPAITGLGNAPSNAIVSPSPPGNSPIPLPVPPGHPSLRIYPVPPGALPARPALPRTGPTNLYWLLRSNSIALPSAPTNIPPGVYKTAPYSCIVVVPGPHPDDKCIVNPGPWDSSMPIVKPDLQFIPLDPLPPPRPDSTADGQK